MEYLCAGGRRFLAVDMSGARDGDIARLQYPSVQLEAGSCLHLDYRLVGAVQLEIGYQLNVSDGHLLCILAPNSTHVGWFSADVLIPAGQYQLLYFDAVFLSLRGEMPLVAVDSIKLLDENCSRIEFRGKSSTFVDTNEFNVCIVT